MASVTACPVVTVLVIRDSDEPAAWDSLWQLWKLHGKPDPPDIPEQALISEGVSHADYVEWRMSIEDERRLEKEMRADAAAVAARDADLRARGMEPMPPRRTPEESAAIDRRDEEAEDRRRQRDEHAGKSEWLPDDDDDAA